MLCSRGDGFGIDSGGIGREADEQDFVECAGLRFEDFRDCGGRGPRRERDRIAVDSGRDSGEGDRPQAMRRGTAVWMT